MAAKAFLYVPPSKSGRQERFIEGLRRVGYKVVLGDVPVRAGPSDVAVAWNLHGRRGQFADMVRSRGGRVIVVENGYCGTAADGEPYLAMSLDAHLGAGRWFPREDTRRWDALGLELGAWRSSGAHILICASRGIGGARTAMPRQWVATVKARLEAITDRPLRVRQHPRTQPDGVIGPLAADLAGAHAVVVWGSNAGTQALLAGVPVFYDHPLWIMAPAAKHRLEEIEAPFLGDRGPAFVRMSWAQWSLAEIGDGAPFAHLLGV